MKPINDELETLCAAAHRATTVSPTTALDESLLAFGVAKISAPKPPSTPSRLPYLVAAASLFASSISLAMVGAPVRFETSQFRTPNVSAGQMKADDKAGPATRRDNSLAEHTAADSPTAEPSTTEPVATEPVTTEPGTGEPVATIEPERPATAVRAPQRGPRRSAATAGPPANTPAAPARSASLEDRSIEELLRLASGMPEMPEHTETSMSEPAPLRLLRPERDVVARTFRALQREIERCAPNTEGVLTTRVTLVGVRGAPRSARLSGVSLSDSEEQCITETLMGVRVDPFVQTSLQITFPYRL